MPKITIREAVDVLRRHNDWRRGDDVEMLDPSAVSRAIEAVVAHFDALAAAAANQARALGAAGRKARARAGGLAKSAAKYLKD
jgi:hypothetical protein